MTPEDRLTSDSGGVVPAAHDATSAGADSVREAVASLERRSLPSTHLVRRLRRMAQVCAALVLGTGLLVMVGWIVSAEALTRIAPGQPGMRFNAALGFVLLGTAVIALLQQGMLAHVVTTTCAALIGAGAVVILLEHLIDRSLGIDDPFGLQGTSPAPGATGRPAGTTAVCFLLFALALAALRLERDVAAQVMAAVTLAAGLAALVGYAYGVRSLYEVGVFNAMAVHTAAAVVTASTALLIARADRGPVALLVGNTAGGTTARRLLPAAVLAPLLAGWVIVSGLAGGAYEPRLALALLASTVAVGGTALVWANGARLRHVDLRRAGAEQALVLAREALATVEALAESLRESQQNTQRILDTARDAYVAMDETGRIVAWNPTAERTFGWSAAEAVGRQLDELLIPAADRQAHRQGLAHFLATGEGPILGRRIEVTALRRRGTVPVELVVWDVADTRPLFHAFIRDITERREAEHALQASERLFRLAQHAAPTGFALVAMDGTWVSTNPALCGIVGRAREELQSLTLADITHPDDREADAALVQQLLAGEITDYQVTRRLLHADGTVIWTTSSVALVRDDSGEPLHLICQVEDISKRKRAEEALLRANDDLREFAAIAAHDLRTPLGVIQVYADLLLRRDQGQMPQEQREEWVEVMRSSAIHGSKLIDELLAYVGIGQAQLQPRDVSLTRLAREVADELTMTSNRRGTVEVADLPHARGDEGQLRQLLTNLIGNGLKYVPEGRVPTVTVDAAPLPETGSKRLLLRVGDNGVGVPPEERERIFAMFQRGSSGTSFEGTGVGLAICRRVAERHGGQVWVEENDTGGSTFLVTLPAATSAN